MSIRPDGTHTEIAVSAIIYPEHGYIEGCIIDMTEKKQTAREKKQLQANLQQAQKMEAIGTLFIQTANVRLDKKFVKPYNMGAGDYVNVTMKDTGVGMDANTLKRVFDPFFTTKEKERGTGLGLASAYGIITALSEEGQGATFNIYLPAFT